MAPSGYRWLKWLILAGALLGLCFVAVLGYVAVRRHVLEDRIRDMVVAEMSERFKTNAQLGSIDIVIWPDVEVVGRNLSLPIGNRTDVPPLIQIGRFAFKLGFLGVLRAPKHIAQINLDKMVITIPPRGQTKQPSALGSMMHGKHLGVAIDEIVCDDADLILLPKDPKKEPLDFDIHNLVLRDVIPDQAFFFHGNLTNAKPKGEILTDGKLGPWDTDEPRNTSVSGNYTFTNADLNPFPGIGGTLSSTGQYDGQLDKINVQGKTDTPNFSLDPVGRGVPLHTDFSATVDGTNGDTYLHPVKALLGKSLITASGSVVKIPNEGHLITLDVVAPDARMEDILSLAMKSDKPVLTGATNIKSKLIITPGKAKTLDRLELKGNFGVKNAKFSSAEVRDKLQSLSRHALGEPSNPEAGSAVSDMSSDFHLHKSVIDLQNLVFSIEGATLMLDGTYSIRPQTLDFSGQLRLHAKLSQLTTGVKSVLLKPVDPFFEKKGAGSVLPVTITGTRNEPTIGVTVFHKTIKKKMSEDKAKPAQQ